MKSLSKKIFLIFIPLSKRDNNFFHLSKSNNFIEFFFSFLIRNEKKNFFF
jgi:hypothetical protein